LYVLGRGIARCDAVELPFAAFAAILSGSEGQR
jgi:hypothetical protein